MRHEEVAAGIQGYARSRELLKRAARRFGGFSQHDFDRWMGYRRAARQRSAPRPAPGLFAQSFILAPFHYTPRNAWLDLLQLMIANGEMTVTRDEHDVIRYGLPHDR